MSVKNDLVLKAYDRYPVDVVNLSAHDLVYVSKLLRSGGAAQDRPPVLQRMVSANTLADAPGWSSPRPFLIREIPARKASTSGAKPIRVAFVGLSEQSPQPPSGLKILDPIEAGKRVVPEARRRADLVIVLAHGKIDEIVRIAREVPDIDVVIAGTGDMFTPPMRIGETLVAFTAFETRMLGEVRVYRDPEGKFSTRERFISLDVGVGDDLEAAKVAADVTTGNLEAYKANQSELNKWLALANQNNGAKARTVEAGPYVSATSCAQCHAAQYSVWVNGPHARASTSLVLKQTDADASCLACHGSGLQKSGVLTKGEVPQLLNVQCEQCHGPGAQHVARPAKGYGRIANLSSVCSGCHTRQVSPGFDLKSHWEKIKH